MNSEPRENVDQSADAVSSSGPDKHGDRLLPEVPTGERKMEKRVMVGVTAGFEHYRFRHAALPEIDFDDIALDTTFLGTNVRTPLLISSMTGGSKTTGEINMRLAEAAERRGWAFGVGSVRAAVEKEGCASTFRVVNVRRACRLLLIWEPCS